MEALSPPAPRSPRRSPSRSPQHQHQHTLRSRRSFPRPPFSPKPALLNALATKQSTDKLRSPLKLNSDASASSSHNSTTTAMAPTTSARGRGRGGGALLFPASPAAHQPLETDASNCPAPPPREPTGAAGLKKLATSLQGAFATKGKGARPAGSRNDKQGFDLSDWNHDLAAIASHPSSSSTTAPSPTNDEQPLPLPRSSRPARISTTGYTRPITRSSEEIVTPTTSLNPGLRSLPRGLELSHALELPTTTTTTTVETRRRKSDEMEEEERDQFQHHQAIAPAVRRESHHGRSHSLAHAHTLRSSRTLSHHAASSSAQNDSPRAGLSPRASTSHSPYSIPAPSPNSRTAHSIAFTNPFGPDDSFTSSHHPNAPPPSKKMSVEGLGKQRAPSVAAAVADEDSLMSDSVFGGGGTPIASSPVAAGKKPGGGGGVSRAKSLSRTSVPSFNIVPIPSSNSHPGWIGEGFDTAPPLGTSRFNGGLASPNDLGGPVKARSRTASSVTNLDTLSESGPPPDYFSVPSREGARTPDGVSDSLGTMTPPRRRSEFSLFGSSVPATLGTTGTRKAGGEGRRSSISMPDITMVDEGDVTPDEDEAIGSNAPRRRRSLNPTLNARRVANIPHLEHSPVASTSSAAHHHYHHPDNGNGSSIPFPSRRAASLDSLFLASIQAGDVPSPFGRAGTVTTPNGHQQHVHASVHHLRDVPTPIGGRKRNANGALLVGAGAATGSKLGAVSPIVAAPSSPAPWQARQSRTEMEEEEEEDEEDEAMEDEQGGGGWDGTLSPPPALTDGTTSASSSLSTSLSSHAEGDQVFVAGVDQGGPTASTSSRSISASSSTGAPGTEGVSFFTPQNYKHVKPLQAAFMSTGLVSKRSRPRSSSVNSGPPPFNLHQHLLQSQLDERASTTFSSSSSAEPSLPSAEIHPLPSLLPRSASIMPDTPVKKSAFSGSTSSKSLNLPGVTVDTANPRNDDPSDDSNGGSPGPSLPQLQSKKSLSPLGGGRSSSCSSSRSSSTMGSASKLSDGVITVSPQDSPLGSVAEDHHRQTGDVSPTVHASRGSTRASTTGRPARIRPTMFRRRSSGQLSTEGSFLGVMPGKSGSSSGSSAGTMMMVEGEPMTPTRSSGGRWWDGEFCLIGARLRGGLGR